MCAKFLSKMWEVYKCIDLCIDLCFLHAEWEQVFKGGPPGFDEAPANN